MADYPEVKYKQYHCFWINPHGMQREYKVFDDEAAVLELVKENEKPQDEYRNVNGLVVIYGVKVEFEPAVVVQSYKIKDWQED